MATRLYSVFSVDSTGKRKRYHRMSDKALPLADAKAFWQSVLARVTLGGRERVLRPVR